MVGKSSTMMGDTPRTSPNFERNVVRFRPRDAGPFPEKRPPDSAAHDVCALLDLSRYELSDHSRCDPHSRKSGLDDFKHRMRANIAALIFLVALAGLAAADVLKLEEAQMSCPVETTPCGPLI
jgi:hypothetical protein